MNSFLPSMGTYLGLIFGAMAALAVLEAVIPLRAREAAHRAHLAANLALTAITIVSSAAMNLLLVAGLAALQARGAGLLNAVDWSPAAALCTVVLGLDFSYYAAHIGMHRLPLLWRFHRVHHSDQALDVTSSIRQHPGESLYRYMVIAAVALPLGASPEAFAVYRVASAVNALIEHANIRVPRWLGIALSWVTTWPDVHKVHHSRLQEETDSNFGNLFSWWDRLFSTFKAAPPAARIAIGLDGHDAPEQQTTRGLLAMPFAERPFTPPRREA